MFRYDNKYFSLPPYNQLYDILKNNKLTEEMKKGLDVHQEYRGLFGPLTPLGVAMYVLKFKSTEKDNFFELSDIELLLKAGSDPNHHGVKKALHYYLEGYKSLESQVELIRIFAKYKMVFSLAYIKDHDYHNVIDVFARPAIFKILEEYDSRFECGHGESYFHEVVKYSNASNMIKLFVLMKKSGLNLDKENYAGNTPLLIVAGIDKYSFRAGQNYLIYLKFLLDEGAKITTINDEGNNILHILFSASFDKNDEHTRREMIYTVISHIEEKGGEPLLKSMLEAKNKIGDTPLHSAAKQFRESISRTTVNFLFDIYKTVIGSHNILNAQQQTVLEVANFKMNKFWAKFDEPLIDEIAFYAKSGVSFFHAGLNDAYLLHRDIQAADPSIKPSLNYRRKLTFLSGSKKQFESSSLYNFFTDPICETKLVSEIFSFMPREDNYFDQYDRMTPAERKEKFSYYQEQKQYTDFDNASAVNSASQLLKSLNVPETKFAGLMVGPSRQDEPWSLAEQLNKILSFPELKSKRYLLFVIPTRNGRHATAAVIDLKAKEIICIDSKGYSLLIPDPLNPGTQTNTWVEAIRQIEQAIEKTPALYGFKLISPNMDRPQQSAEDNLNCGIWAAMNMVGIICNKEKNTYCPKEILIKSDGSRHDFPADMIEKYIGVLLLAKEDFCNRKKADPAPFALGMFTEVVEYEPSVRSAYL